MNSNMTREEAMTIVMQAAEKYLIHLGTLIRPGPEGIEVYRSSDQLYRAILLLQEGE